jgi:hypothetical protein
MKTFFVLVFFLLSSTSNAYAYIDPGTVSIVLQGLISAVAATIVALKIYWVKVLKFFGIQKKNEIIKENNKEKNNT